jgi:hypothetical protein
MRIGRARVARGLDSAGEAGATGGIGASDGLIGSGASANAPFAPAGRPPAPDTASDEGIDQPTRFRPWSETTQPGSGPMRCIFLRSVGPDGRLGDPQKTAVPTHRCAAFGDPLPLSLRQQELVCLQRVHVSCPRYVRGTLLANENKSTSKTQPEQSDGVPVLTIVGVGLVILALGVLLTAGLGLPPFSGGGSAGPAIAAASLSASPSRGATLTPAATPKPTAQSSATVVATTTPPATATPAPTNTPTPAAPTWPPGATASRMNLVVPCTDQANCYVYTVRGAGSNGSGVADDVAGIARFFGVDQKAIFAMNPGSSSGISPGQKLKIPPPTR